MLGSEKRGKGSSGGQREMVRDQIGDVFYGKFMLSNQWEGTAGILRLGIKLKILL